MKNLVLTLFVLTIMSGCANQKRCTKLFPCHASVIRDSIYIETIKEVPVIIPGDSITNQVPVYNCPDQEILTQENDWLQQSLKIVNGKLIQALNRKPIEKLIPVKEIEIKVEKQYIPVPEKYIPKWMKYITGSAILIIALFIMRIKNRIFGFFS